MTGFAGTRPDASLLARIRAGEVGGVILFARNIAGRNATTALVAELQRAAAAGGNPPLLVAVDQEGGAVRRFDDGPPDLAPAAMRTAATAHAEGAATGRYLRALGVDVDLAPVLDAPDSPSSFLGTRAFSGDPALNARLGDAFVRGLQGARVAATAKHFPGLGTARASTDTSHVWITTPRPALEARLLPFAAAVQTGVDLVMVGNAGYAALDPSGLPAVLSKPIVTGLLRRRLGFGGVVISDAMEAPGPAGRAHAPVRALAAGVDVLLYADEADSAVAYRELLAADRPHSPAAGALRAANARIAALKARLARP
jgi:beta-N-acetylhexosaminidase